MTEPKTLRQLTAERDHKEYEAELKERARQTHKKEYLDYTFPMVSALLDKLKENLKSAQSTEEALDLYQRYNDRLLPLLKG